MEFSSPLNRGNLTNKNTFKFSNVANKKAVGLVANPEGGVILSVKSKKGSNARKPASLYNKVTLKRDFRRVAKLISNATAGDYYRPDLKQAALARWSAIHLSQEEGSSGH
eukprot:EC120733.1.p1 GENE.EC120733.1~~EC120733.1.p1  ORF type:complete len:110 (+),score=27.71 EC120733.1:24-353(+)